VHLVADGEVVIAVGDVEGLRLRDQGGDHNLAVGDKVHKAGVLAFLDARP
jgi:hypothetical protein